jgi:hypothetical protein
MRNLSRLFDASSDRLEALLANDMKYDTSYRHTNCQDDGGPAPTGGICSYGYWGHFCFFDDDDYLPCVAVVDA